MAQSFGGDFQLVEVTTDELVGGVPKQQLWVAAAKPEQAVTLVLAQVPEGWGRCPIGYSDGASGSGSPQAEAWRCSSVDEITPNRPKRDPTIAVLHVVHRGLRPPT